MGEKSAQMKIPYCSVCHTKYNEEENCPLLLQCGHGFCKECLSRMFADSTDTTLICPRCRQSSLVGNSVQALKKNYAVLGIIQSAASNSDEDDDDNDQEDADGKGKDDEYDNELKERRRCQAGASISGLIELGFHQDLRLVGRIVEGRRNGVEMWVGVVSGSGQRRCRHIVAVEKIMVGEDMDLVWVQSQLENLRRASMWCRNVCAFHGILKIEGCLNLVMDKCNGSVLTEMERNGGRLTLEQILRFCF